MKIAYLSDMDPRQGWSYSGGNTRILNALEGVADVTVLSQRWGKLEPLRRLLHRMPDSINLRLRWRLHLLFAPFIAREVAKELAKDRYDALVCAYSFHALAKVRLPYPMLRVFTSDATPTVYKRSEIGRAFGSFLSISRLMDRWILRHERAVMRANDLNLWPSEWQSDGASAIYGLGADKSVILPWGANVSDPGTPGPLPEIGPDRPLRLLLVGRDWQMKGGPLAVAVISALRARGIAAELDVIGCHPGGYDGRSEIRFHAYLDKTKPAELARFEQLFRQAHFLIGPSFESYGFAFCEASAYALPALCLDIGGIPVFDGENGLVLSADADAELFCEAIEPFLTNPDSYAALRASARRVYETQLNWPAWADRAVDLMRERIRAKS